MLQIIGALCIFFFIIVPFINWLGTVDFSSQRTLEQRKQAELIQKAKENEARIKQLQWHIKYPYIIPGIVGFFIIMAASTSPYVNHVEWYMLTLFGVVFVSILYQQMLKAALKKKLNE